MTAGRERARAIGLALALLVAALAAGAGPAAAQPAGDRGEADRAKAAAHFRQGQAYFKAGEFDRAIAEYQAAFDLSAEPSLIFNIGLCHVRAERPEPALAAFRRYLELAPEGNVAEEAREEIARLAPIVDTLATERDARLAAERDAKLAAEREAQRAAEEARRRQQRAEQERSLARSRRVALYVTATGAVVVGLGAAFHLMAWRTRGQLESAPDPDTYFADRDAFKLRRAVAVGAYATGAATVATGLILRHLVFRSDDSLRVSAAVAPGAALVTVGWTR